MPHTDTNISRDALRSYGMQPARQQDHRRQEGRTEYGGQFRVCGGVQPGGVLKALQDHMGGWEEVYDRPGEEVRAPGQPQGGRDGTHVYMHGGRAGSEPFL